MKGGKVVLRAPAKVNLLLRLLAARRDGYHEICSVMQTVDVFDHLTVEPADALVLHCTGAELPCDSRNLVIRAAHLLRKKYDVRLGCRLRLFKAIPVAAGLGGGSADAAAALIGLNRFWRLHLDRTELAACAALLGSDVSFFLTGGTALITGRGEVIKPLPSLAGMKLVLVNPGFELPTPGVFARHREAVGLGLTSYSAVPSIRHLFPGHDPGLLADSLGNDLEGVATAMRPEIGACRRALIQAGATAAVMTGSGPTVVGLFGDPVAAEQARERLSHDFHWVRKACTVRTGIMEVTDACSGSKIEEVL
ncbi:4-(cytidine 5'-diphospho)-2-C-methyl-D-erythritol kinase [bacterium]|nr:4-(cytidine 5'-diphospho)-2-C-methyl-D-erythritol kinase [candidate division CSSED10-310 bacterium]